MIGIKQNQDGFLWKVITADSAKAIVREGKSEVYRLYEDDTEGLIEDISEIDTHANKGGAFGLECTPQPSKKNLKRVKSFFDANGHPKKVRIYDNERKSFDQYTIVYTGNYRETTAGEFYYIASSSYPSHPQGFWEHGSTTKQIDRPTYSHLGKKIKFAVLPDDVKNSLISDYLTFWGFTDERDKWI